MKKIMFHSLAIVSVIFFLACSNSDADKNNKKADEPAKDVKEDVRSNNIGESRDSITIVLPKNGDSVLEQPYIEGTVRNPVSDVWVVIHPMEVSEYWVQAKVNVRKSGEWAAQVYVGQPGNKDFGKRFEIIAVANPKDLLKEGMKLNSWPKAEHSSDFIVVVRK